MMRRLYSAARCVVLIGALAYLGGALCRAAPVGTLAFGPDVDGLSIALESPGTVPLAGLFERPFTVVIRNDSKGPLSFFAYGLWMRLALYDSAGRLVIDPARLPPGLKVRNLAAGDLAVLAPGAVTRQRVYFVKPSAPLRAGRYRAKAVLLNDLREWTPDAMKAVAAGKARYWPGKKAESAPVDLVIEAKPAKRP